MSKEIVAAMLNKERRVISYASFSCDEQLQRHLVEAKKKGQTIKTMQKSVAAEHLLTEEPVPALY